MISNIRDRSRLATEPRIAKCFPRSVVAHAAGVTLKIRAQFREYSSKLLRRLHSDFCQRLIGLRFHVRDKPKKAKSKAKN
jgi:hypothetical protein